MRTAVELICNNIILICAETRYKNNYRVDKWYPVELHKDVIEDYPLASPELVS